MSDPIGIACSDIGVEYRDAGPWRNYELTTSGRDFPELMNNATITEVDQDGGELATYGLSDAAAEVYVAVEKIIRGRVAAVGAA